MSRRSRASSISRKSSISELYAEYSRMYDAREKLIRTQYNQEMVADKLDRRSFELQYRAHAYPEDPRKTKGERATQGDLEKYEKWKQYRKYSAKRIIETIVTKETSAISYKSAAVLQKKIREKFEALEAAGVPEDEIEVAGRTKPPTIAEIRYAKTNEFWDVVKEWYDEEGRALYQEERAKGKSGKEARKAIYDLFFYNGS